MNNEFLRWQSALKDTIYEKELENMTEAEIDDAFFGELEFGTAGMRGIIGLGTNRMNVFTVRRATEGVAKWLKQSGAWEKGVAIAYDSRHMSAAFAEEAALMLAKNGIRAFLFDTLHSVPQLSFTVLHLGCAAGIVITASHNPKEYNGYKVYGSDGGQLALEDAAAVTRFISLCEDVFSLAPMPKKDALSSSLLTYIGEEVDEAYFAKVKALSFNSVNAQNLKIVYTPLHGSGNVPVRRILGDMGIDVCVVKEQELPNGDFPTVSAPNPESPDAFSLAIPLADKVGADLIIATDPDSDRMGLAVRTACGGFTVLSGNTIGCLLMEYVLKNSDTKNGFVCRSIVSTPLADKIALHYGAEMRHVLTGFKYIAEQIKLSEGKSRFLFGFEESYGFLTGTFVRDKDAIIASMLAAEAACVCAAEGKTLFDAVNDMYETYGFYREKNISRTLSGAEGISKITNAVNAMRDASPKNIGGFSVLAVSDFSSGVRTDAEGNEAPLSLPKTNMLLYELCSGTLIFRPSGTEPKLKAYCSVCADNGAAADALVNRLAASADEFINQFLK